MGELLKTVGKWLSGERVPLGTKRAILVFASVSALAFSCGVRDLRIAAAPLTHAKPPPPLPGDGTDGTRWGMPLERRKEIFTELASAEPAARMEAAKAFNGPGLEWSAEDHRGSFERTRAKELSSKYHVTVEQVYLCLDEGIRERWPGPDGQPLEAQVVPLNPRRKYGW